MDNTKLDKSLIAKVCEHELLYAVDAADYRDRHMRAMAWSDIGRELGISAAQCKDMWRKLRNCYLNAINRRQNKNIPKWKYEDEMSFLLPFVDIRPPAPENHAASSSSVSAIYNNDIMEGDMGLDEHEDSSEMILPETSTLVTKTEQPDDYFTPPALKRHRSRMSYNNGTNGSKDEIDMFFLSICETVKRLSAVDQAKIKMELCKLVYEAEIRALEHAQYEEGL